MNQYDKIICVCDYVFNDTKYLTKGTQYTIIDKINAVYNSKVKSAGVNVLSVRILNDFGHPDWYFIEHRFITLEEYRNSKLESIGI